MLFHSERLYTRYFTMDDLDVFFRLNGDENIVRYIRAPKTYDECREFLTQIISWYDDSPVNWRIALASSANDEVIGSFAIMPLSGTGDLQLGYSLLAEHWGKGYATEISLAGAAYAFEQLGLSTITAITEAANIASQNVLLKCGFWLEEEYEDRGKLLHRYRLNRL
ncbi:MAG: hypothetical protein DI535_00620 [Citrobacter freundii]|nr:MAG: hypothetical protein DI535_00620 [Citrobacter freundii]